MQQAEHENWIINIENSAAIIASQIGPAIVHDVLHRHGAHNAEDADPEELPEIFSELYAIEADLK